MNEKGEQVNVAPVYPRPINQRRFFFGGRTQMGNTKKVDVSEQVKSLVNKAEQAEKSDDALKFSQAACNAANAACAANNTANIAAHSTGD